MNFLRSERSSAALLLIAAVLGLAVANLPFGPALIELKNAHIDLPWLGLDLSAGHWISDGLLADFFFIVAVELRRELVIGELNSPSKAMLPAIAAVGGVIVPAVNATKIAAGTTTPPTAAIAGSIAFDSELSSPMTSSRLSSTATMKKNTASSPSVTQCPVDRSSWRIGISRWASFTSMNAGPKGRLAITRPSTAAARRSAAETRSDRRKFM